MAADCFRYEKQAIFNTGFVRIQKRTAEVMKILKLHLIIFGPTFLPLTVSLIFSDSQEVMPI